MVKIYKLLDRIIVNKRHSLSPNSFIEADRTELSEEEKSIFDLLKNIVSLRTKIHNDGIEFHSIFVTAEGRRSFSIEDISEDDYLILHSLELEKMPLILRALIAEIYCGLIKKNLMLLKLQQMHIGNYLLFGIRMMIMLGQLT